MARSEPYLALFFIISDMRTNSRVAIFADLEFAVMASTSLSVYLTNEDGEMLTDEEDDLGRQLKTSDSDQGNMAFI